MTPIDDDSPIPLTLQSFRRQPRLRLAHLNHIICILLNGPDNCITIHAWLFEKRMKIAMGDLSLSQIMIPELINMMTQFTQRDVGVIDGPGSPGVRIRRNVRNGQNS